MNAQTYTLLVTVHGEPPRAPELAAVVETILRAGVGGIKPINSVVDAIEGVRPLARVVRRKHEAVRTGA